MGSLKSPVYSQPFSLDPVNLHGQDEVDELISQRMTAGWEYELEDIHRWRGELERGVKWMWWITAISKTAPEPDSASSERHTSVRAGHIALTCEAHPPDPDLARSDRSILTVKSFFILPEYRRSGLGRATWFEVEKRAHQIPECNQIAIDTLSRRYAVDDGPEWGGLIARYGGVANKDYITEDWYVRMGYEVFKHEPRYGLPDTDEKLVAVFLRKRLR